ncbi:MAG: AMP-binding protein [Candidatus Cloacimonas sp.]|nr:AMP-binding protein [Candidatus Cloacimonadota bacterium]
MQLHWKFIENAKRVGSKMALFDTLSDTSFSYSQLFIASIMIKTFIDKYSSQFVGIMLPPGAGSILSILGTQMSGKVPVMINYATGAIDNAIYAQNKCHFRMIITSRKLLDKLELKPIKGMIFIEDWLEKLSTSMKLKALIKSKLPVSLLTAFIHQGSIDDVAVILFTSGSEKEPKAVQLTHRNILHNVTTIPEIIDVGEEDIFIANLPYFHVFGLTINLWVPLSYGASIVAMPNPLDYKTICEAIKKHNVSIMVGTPTFFWGYAKRADEDTFKSVRYAIAGADKLPLMVNDTYIEKFNLKIFEGYGATETSPVISTNTPTYYKLGSVGKPLPGVKVKICDIDTGKELPVGSEGKILVKGELVMKGYYNDLEETSVRIRDGWYDTGDIGVIDEDGFLWHKGRLKRFVKVAGEMISLVKVEHLLESVIPEGSYCCVVDVPNFEKGADIVACVTTKQFDKKTMLKHLRGKLPPMAIPKELYVMDELPMMASGKVNFREVEKMVRNMVNEQPKEKEKKR